MMLLAFENSRSGLLAGGVKTQMVSERCADRSGQKTSSPETQRDSSGFSSSTNTLETSSSGKRAMAISPASLFSNLGKGKVLSPTKPSWQRKMQGSPGERVFKERFRLLLRAICSSSLETGCIFLVQVISRIGHSRLVGLKRRSRL